MFQETATPAEEKPRAAETSAPVKEANEVAAPTPAQSGVSLNVSKGDDYLFFQPRINGVKPVATFCVQLCENYVLITF